MKTRSKLLSLIMCLYFQNQSLLNYKCFKSQNRGEPAFQYITVLQTVKIGVYQNIIFNHIYLRLKGFKVDKHNIYLKKMFKQIEKSAINFILQLTFDFFIFSILYLHRLTKIIKILPIYLIIQSSYLLQMTAKKQIVRLSLYFFLLFTPFSSFMTILTHIYEEANIPGIGPATLACNYGFFILSTLIAPYAKLSLKRQLLFAGMCYTLNYASGIFASLTNTTSLKFLITCTASSIAGLSAGFLWVSKGRYIHIVCQNFKVQQGEMFGLFSSIYCLSSVSAGLITTFGLGFFNNQIYFLIITALGIISVLYCFFFVKDIQNHSKNQCFDSKDQLTDKSQSLLGASPENANQKNKLTLLQSVKKMIFFVPKMYAVLPFLFIDGFALGIYSSEIPHLIPDSVDKSLINKYAGLQMIVLGVGSVIGGYISGKIADKKGMLASGRIGIGSFILSIGTFVSALYISQMWASFIASFIWGFALFYIQGFMYVACSKCYGGEAQAFSVNKQLHSILYLLFQLMVLWTDNKMPLVPLVTGAAILSLPALFFLNKIPQTKQSIDP